MTRVLTPSPLRAESCGHFSHQPVGNVCCCAAQDKRVLPTGFPRAWSFLNILRKLSRVPGCLRSEVRWVQLQPYALKRTSNTRTRNDDTLSTHTAPTCHVVSSCVDQGNGQAGGRGRGRSSMFPHGSRRRVAVHGAVTRPNKEPRGCGAALRQHTRAPRSAHITAQRLPAILASNHSRSKSCRRGVCVMCMCMCMCMCRCRCRCMCRLIDAGEGLRRRCIERLRANRAWFICTVLASASARSWAAFSTAALSAAAAASALSTYTC